MTLLLGGTTFFCSRNSSRTGILTRSNRIEGLRYLRGILNKLVCQNMITYSIPETNNDRCLGLVTEKFLPTIQLMFGMNSHLVTLYIIMSWQAMFIYNMQKNYKTEKQKKKHYQNTVQFSIVQLPSHLMKYLTKNIYRYNILY